MKVSADTGDFATKETEVSEVTVPSEGSEETNYSSEPGSHYRKEQRGAMILKTRIEMEMKQLTERVVHLDL